MISNHFHNLFAGRFMSQWLLIRLAAAHTIPDHIYSGGCAVAARFPNSFPTQFQPDSTPHRSLTNQIPQMCCLTVRLPCPPHRTFVAQLISQASPTRLDAAEHAAQPISPMWWGLDCSFAALPKPFPCRGWAPFGPSRALRNFPWV